MPAGAGGDSAVSTRRGLLVGGVAAAVASVVPGVARTVVPEQPCMLMALIPGSKSLGIYNPKSGMLVEMMPWEEGMPEYPFSLTDERGDFLEPSDPAWVRAKHRISQAEARRWLRMV